MAIRGTSYYTFVGGGTWTEVEDLSIALGQTNRIPITLAYWIPVIIIGLFSFVGILQINEK